MKEADLILWKTRETVTKFCGPLTCDDFRAISIASRNRLRPRPNFFASRVDFGAISEGFRRPKRPKNRFEGRFFAMLVSSAVLHRFWVHLWRLQALKNRFSLQRGANVHKTDFLKKSAEKSWFWFNFGMPKPLKINKRSCLKLMFFQHRFFCGFSLVFSDVGSILGGPGRFQNCKKSLKIALGPRLERVWTFGTLSETIWMRC